MMRVRVTAGLQAGARGAALGSLDECVLEEHATARKAVDVRGPYDRVPVATQSVPPLVISYEYQDVGFSGVSSDRSSSQTYGGGQSRAN